MPYGCQNTIAAEFIGQSPETLRGWLNDAQVALQQLELGQNPNSVSYAQGAGGKSVAFSAATPEMLRARIRLLSVALGLIPNRRARGFRF